MVQSLATLVFAAAAFSALLVIAGQIASDWYNVRAALGLTRTMTGYAVSPRIRMVPARRVVMLRVTPAAMRNAA